MPIWPCAAGLAIEMPKAAQCTWKIVKRGIKYDAMNLQRGK